MFRNAAQSGIGNKREGNALKFHVSRALIRRGFEEDFENDSDELCKQRCLEQALAQAAQSNSHDVGVQIQHSRSLSR